MYLCINANINSTNELVFQRSSAGFMGEEVLQRLASVFVNFLHTQF